MLLQCYQRVLALRSHVLCCRRLALEVACVEMQWCVVLLCVRLQVLRSEGFRFEG
jgi:hypothetical protein